jgi:hypothetical protein
MRTSNLPSRIVALIGAIVISTVLLAPYDVQFAVRHAISAAKASTTSWVLAVRNAGSPPRT